jgi:hypothetical protein
MNQGAKFITLQLLRAYQWAISPMFPPACRYLPTCSDYAMEAVERFGALRGGWMGCARLLRCHPFARSGYDPVVRNPAVRIEELRANEQTLNDCGDTCVPGI